MCDPVIIFDTSVAEAKHDPRFPELLRAFMIGRQNPDFRILWDTLFTQNDAGLTDQVYANGCAQFLRVFGEDQDAPAPQTVALSGHISTRGGHTIVNTSHLRIASAAHAHPRQDGEYLLLDCAAPVASAHDLVPHLRSLFD